MFARRIFSTVAATAAGSAGVLKATVCDEEKVHTGQQQVMNSAFLFIKPHANTTAVQTLVSSKLHEHDISITSQGSISAAEIDDKRLIDQHYYAIASKATLLKPKDMPVPAAKFEEAFGLSWKDALNQNLVFNALDACKFLGVDAMELDALWVKAKKVKFGGGFYAGKVIHGNKEIYVFNAFFMSMRSKFVQPGTSIHYYTVDFDPSKLSWTDFRGSVLGPTDPNDGPKGSLRHEILLNWQQLGLQGVPNVGDNGVHASASPFEGLAERMNWLSVDPSTDSFGKRLIENSISVDTIKTWSIDPQIKGKSIFDQLEDTDANDCIKKCIDLNKG